MAAREIPLKCSVTSFQLPTSANGQAENWCRILALPSRLALQRLAPATSSSCAQPSIRHTTFTTPSGTKMNSCPKSTTNLYSRQRFPTSWLRCCPEGLGVSEVVYFGQQVPRKADSRKTGIYILRHHLLVFFPPFNRTQSFVLFISTRSSRPNGDFAKTM